MRRLDVPLDGGARLVVLCEGDEVWVRLLRLVGGGPTCATPMLPLSPEDEVALAERVPCFVRLDGMSIEVLEGEESLRCGGCAAHWNPRRIKRSRLSGSRGWWTIAPCGSRGHAVAVATQANKSFVCWTLELGTLT